MDNEQTPRPGSFVNRHGQPGLVVAHDDGEPYVIAYDPMAPCGASEFELTGEWQGINPI